MAFRVGLVGIVSRQFTTNKKRIIEKFGKWSVCETLLYLMLLLAYSRNNYIRSFSSIAVFKYLARLLIYHKLISIKCHRVVSILI